MSLTDIGRVPMDCHGDRDILESRIADLGAAAILAFDGDRHVGQIQFRRHDAQLRSEDGIWRPDYWGDFGGRGGDLPYDTLGIFCFHVGQLTDGDERDPRYQGRGIGLALLDQVIDWARARGLAAIAAKATPPAPAVMRFMGGLPASLYKSRGFEVRETWVDDQLLDAVRSRGLVALTDSAEASASVGMCVKRL